MTTTPTPTPCPEPAQTLPSEPDTYPCQRGAIGHDGPHLNQEYEWHTDPTFNNDPTLRANPEVRNRTYNERTPA